MASERDEKREGEWKAPESGFQLWVSVLLDLCPQSVVVSSREDERLLQLLHTRLTDASSQNDDDADRERNVVILPSVDFSLDVAQRRVLDVRLPVFPEDFGETERSMYIQSVVPFENHNMVRATGALLRYLEKKRIGVQLEADNVRVPVTQLATFSITDQLIIDEASYRSLQIFQRDIHPSAFKAGSFGSGKEGLSIFGLLNKCVSNLGAKNLRKWLMRPTRNRRVLTQRMEAIEFFSDVRLRESVQALRLYMRQIHSVAKIVHRLSHSCLTVNDWKSLYRTTLNASYVGDVCRRILMDFEQASTVDLVQDIADAFDVRLTDITAMIDRVMDFEESTRRGIFVAKDGVEPELDEKRRQYADMPAVMAAAAQQDLCDLPVPAASCSVVYVPQLGFLLAVPRSGAFNESTFVPGAHFLFVAQNFVHYKTARTRELDAQMGDAQSDIADQEVMIMHRLQNTITRLVDVYPSVITLTAELDTLIALAQVATDHDFCKPILVDDSIIMIDGGRHPLQELCVSPFIPNDTRSGPCDVGVSEQTSKVKVITGPNASGKSIYLKQVALICFMAHVGSFVPAEMARIGPIDRIFTRIRTMESVSVAMSTFMIDLNQVSMALVAATGRSLVILDEFGKGTQSDEGLALLAESCRYWLSRGPEYCPHVFVSTHFRRLTQILRPSPLLEFQSMEVREDADDEVVLLFKLTAGVCRSSFAYQVASAAGIPAALIQRAHDVSDALAAGRPVLAVDGESMEAQLVRAEPIVSKFVAMDLVNCPFEEIGALVQLVKNGRES